MFKYVSTTQYTDIAASFWTLVASGTVMFMTQGAKRAHTLYTFMHHHFASYLFP